MNYSHEFLKLKNQILSKKLMLTLTFVVISLFAQQNVYAQDTEQALTYMKELTSSFNKLKDDTWKYLKAVTRGKGAKKIETTRQALILQIKTVKTEVAKTKEYEYDGGLKKAIVDYLDLSHSVLKEDFDKILNMEEIAEQSYDSMEAYLLAQEKASEKLDNAAKSIQEAQKVFAEKNNIKIIEEEDDELTKKINKAGQVLKYYNQVYLIFFKSYKQEAYVLDAVQRNDVSGMEQNTSSLSSFVSEGLTKLQEMESFSGDGNLKAAAKQLLTFYKKEAEKDFPSMVDFCIKKDNFEKIQKTVEAKAKKDRTQQDIDKLNAAGKEYNEGVQKYNQTNELTFNERKRLLDLWNQKVEGFFSTHAQ